MKKNGKNEELQSRREFFKRAAKGALPILAGAALLSSPILSETANAMSCAGCNNRCMNSCFNTLKSYIYNSVAELRFKTNMVKATKDNRPFSSGVFDLEEFNIYTKVIDLPLDGIPTYLEEGINGVCTGGSALFNVFSNKRRVVKNDLITIFPYQLASITEISTDFAVIFFKVPKKLFMDTINGLGRLTLDYFFYMRKYYSSPLSEEEYKRFVHFCHILSCRVDLSCAFLRRESVMYLLRVYYWDLYVGYKSNPKAMASVKFVRKEKQVFEFFYLVIEYHTISRDVAFYADKMCISPKYLTMLITDNTGRSAKEWIVEYTILEIKVLLKDSNLEIKEVVSRTNFQSNSTMTRFFRKHTGTTPSEYRERMFV